MAWRIIKQPNGKFARFTDVVDDFTDYDLTYDEVVNLCRHEHGMTLLTAQFKVANAMHTPHRFSEAITTIKLIHGADLAMEREKELSATEQ